MYQTRQTNIAKVKSALTPCTSESDPVAVYPPIYICTVCLSYGYAILPRPARCRLASRLPSTVHHRGARFHTQELPSFSRASALLTESIYGKAYQPSETPHFHTSIFWSIEWSIAKTHWIRAWGAAPSPNPMSFCYGPFYVPR